MENSIGPVHALSYSASGAISNYDCLRPWAKVINVLRPLCFYHPLEKCFPLGVFILNAKIKQK